MPARPTCLVYAEILGWGVSSGAKPSETESHASSQLLAMKRAYERSAVDPADIHFIEGNGARTPADDEAELAALSQLRAHARALGIRPHSDQSRRTSATPRQRPEPPG